MVGGNKSQHRAGRSWASRPARSASGGASVAWSRSSMKAAGVALEDGENCMDLKHINTVKNPRKNPKSFKNDPKKRQVEGV